VTREEKHSTRGRARLLFEMLHGEPLTDGWRSEAVEEALDLCLACKGCKSDCPVNVDMATYKAEFLSHHYAGGCGPRTPIRWADPLGGARSRRGRRGWRTERPLCCGRPLYDWGWLGTAQRLWRQTMTTLAPRSRRARRSSGSSPPA
jgi:Fe-S oxidoreductase